MQHMTRHNLHVYKGASTDIRVIIFSLLTFSHVRPSLSTNILISSGMAREGWVSLSWMATYQVQHTRITILDSIPTILDKSPQDSHALVIISGFAHKMCILRMCIFFGSFPRLKWLDGTFFKPRARGPSVLNDNQWALKVEVAYTVNA